MAGGGRRAGAGRPEGGISQARRLLVAALNRGLAIAGREKGLKGSEEEVATESAAQIAADMIRSGRGDEVLKLYAVAAPKGDEDGGQKGGRSALLDALTRLPGAIEAPQASRIPDNDEQTPTKSEDYARCSTDTQSGVHLRDAPEPPFEGMFFQPQPLLFAPSLLPAAAGQGAHDGQGSRAPATPPTPPHAEPSPAIGLRGENFEKNESAPLEQVHAGGSR
ncbi:MAG: hypothetical protein CVV05_15420 [Gammaproteobacteria bacterium HGW-Gammaproteobacteria-1]|nr:MAG: hypothetical protein CVV05_15420 [Gammaproteobacteria bacterium HGW-Gammaproteobacteria-1]